MKIRTVICTLILVLALGLSACNLNGSGSDDTDLPASGATTTPTNGEEAKALYLEVSEVLYDEIDPLGENESKALASKAAKVAMTINQNLSEISRNGITMKGTVTGTIDSNMPTSSTAGSFSNTIDITVDMDGTMDQFEVVDPNDSTKKYTVSGTIKNKMHTKMSMSMSIDANQVPTPSGTLDMEISLTTNFAVKRSDGTGARFKLVFEDTSPQINLGAMGQGQAGTMPCGADAYTKEATLYTYDDSGTLIAEAKVPLKDTPWMMSNLMGGGGSPSGGGGGGGGGGGSTPITIPDSVADDPAFNSKEADFFNAIDTERTTNSAPSLVRDAKLDALAQRYADVGKCEPIGENLINRIKDPSVLGSCSDAAHFVMGSSSTGIAVNSAMSAWLAQTGGTSVMRRTTFTKIGIAVLQPKSIPSGTPPVAECVVILLATP